jgi:hypothetical protein
MDTMAEYVDGLPNLCGQEPLISEAIEAGRQRPLFQGGADIERAASTFAVALHMHQPLIPAAGDDLRSAGIISNLAWMIAHPGLADSHNAPVFVWCYRRMGEFIAQLLDEGRQPRVMLDYSGTLLHGMRQMGLDDVFDALSYLTHDGRARQTTEWLGSTWGHAVAPSTPVQDYRLHVRAWQHHFAAIFGLEALGRIRGFSPAEMALPNQPDVAYQFVRTLLDCGYEWVLVQEHTVEQPGGSGVERPHLPHRLVCADSHGNTASIIAVIKSRGSDTKLVGQMQPYYEAKGVGPVELVGRRVPPLVTQIADGENGGVIMNEFPPKYLEVMRECSGSPTPAVNVTEYLEALTGRGSAARTFHLCNRCSSIGSGSVSSPAKDLNGSLRSSASSGPKTTGSAWRAAAGPTTSHGCAGTTTCWHLWSVRARSSASTCWPRACQPATLATGARCSICWPVKPAATATGARASGRITALSSPSAPARPPARRPYRRPTRTEG